MMNVKTEFRTMDFERIIYVPFYLIMTVLGFIQIYFDIISRPLPWSVLALAEPLPWDLLTVLLVITKALIVITYLMGVILFIVRSRAVAKSRSLWTKAVAYSVPFIPFLFSIKENNEIIMVPALFSLLLMIFGELFTLYSLKTLGRSFSIAPQVRTLIRSGPYRLIRHPMYVGEFIAFTGLILVGLSILSLFTYFLLITVQIYRVFQEEKLLEQHIPNYSSYKKATKRFIPGLI
jgi:protein-S-isoprenylcysteine O-methyltransferase Ste14